VGVRLDIPTIGIAKHPLVGTPRPAKRSKEGGVPIELDGAIRGYAWTPPGHARPFYVSVGHRISLRTALTLARVATWDAYPEPLRSADRISKEKKEQKNAERSASGQTASWRPPAQGRQGI
jgi:deoxyribonuclease V